MHDHVKNILSDLIQHNKSTNEIKKELTLCERDEIVDIPDELILRNEDVLNIMELFLGEKIDAKELSDWAELVESRDGITYEDADIGDKISMVLFWLSSPEINGELTKDKIQEYITYLEG